MKDISLLVDLFITFLKIGGFTIGGGYAMIPLIQQEVVDKKKWAEEQEMVDFIALSQSLPGVVGINTATSVGYRLKGVSGAVSATLGMVTPSFVIIILIALFFSRLQEIEVVQNAFSGVRAAVVALMFAALIRMCKTSLKDRFQISVAVLAAAVIIFFNVSPQIVIFASAAAAVGYKNIKKEAE